MGAQVNRFVCAGKLIPDKIVNQILRDRLEEHDWHYGFILDGFPRNRFLNRIFLGKLRYRCGDSYKDF